MSRYFISFTHMEHGKVPFWWQAMYVIVKRALKLHGEVFNSFCVCCQIVARGMKARGSKGSIVNVSSQASQCALRDHAVYCEYWWIHLFPKRLTCAVPLMCLFLIFFTSTPCKLIVLLASLSLAHTYILYCYNSFQSMPPPL